MSVGNDISVTCPLCKIDDSVRGLRNHTCIKNNFSKISKQDWWMAVDKARVAAGMEKMVYGYIVTYLLANGTEHDLHGAGTKAQVIMKARLKSLFKEVILIEAVSYDQYCVAYGIPGSKM